MSASAEIVSLVRDRSVVVLTGAGVSTESGIPDYRGPTSSQRRKPVQYQEFIRSEEARRRYWARSAMGWSRISNAVPNRGHLALAELERNGVVKGIITQNVDGLHHAAGSNRVVELHGSLATVRCLGCNTRSARSTIQERLLELNPRWADKVPAIRMAPDGDAELDDSVIENFAVPTCECGGVIKPDVVFFGENVPANVVQEAWSVFDDADVLLVVGSSLEVYSGRRFIYRAQERSIPIGIINLGSTRVDDCAAVKIEAQSGVLLSQLSAALCTKRA